jgi:hypothetical protein
MSAFAKGVASAPQPGQLIGTGIRSLMGSTSNAKRVPHAHSILIFMVSALG